MQSQTMMPENKYTNNIYTKLILDF
jgi:hypothetical protein